MVKQKNKGCLIIYSIIFVLSFLYNIVNCCCDSMGAHSGGPNEGFNPTTKSDGKNMETFRGKSYTRMTNVVTGEEIFIFNTEEDRQLAMDCSISLNTCLDESQTATIDDYHIPEFDIYNDDVMDNMEEFFKYAEADFIVTDENGNQTINKNSPYTPFYEALYGDLDEASKMLKENGKLVNVEFNTGYVMWDRDSKDGGIKYLDATTIEQYKSFCNQKSVNTDPQEMCATVIENANYFNDYATMTPNEIKSCVEKYIANGMNSTEANKQCCLDGGGDEWGSCCSLFHSSEECFGDSDDDETSGECSYNPVKAVKQPSPTRNAEYKYGGTCMVVHVVVHILRYSMIMITK